VRASHRAQATALRNLAFEDFITLAKEKNLASLKLKKGRMLDKKRFVRSCALTCLRPDAAAICELHRGAGGRFLICWHPDPLNLRDLCMHVRWKRAVKSLDTMAVEATGEASAAEPAAAAAAASQSSSSGASAKVTIDMDEL